MFWVKYILPPILTLFIGGGVVWFIKDYAWGKVANEGIEVRSEQTEKLHQFVGKQKEVKEQNDERRKSAREGIPQEWMEQDADPVVAGYLARLFPNTIYQDLRTRAGVVVEAAREAVSESSGEAKE